MKIPMFALPHKIEVYKYLGSGAYGPQWDDTPSYGSARLEPKRQRVTDTEGSEIVANVTAVVHPDTDLEVNDKVKWNGATYTTVDAFTQYTHAGVHHIEAVFK